MEFRVLGSLEVVRGEEGLSLGGPKQRTALALLICRVGELVSSDLLVEELWGEAATSRSRRTLQTYISNLRAQVGDMLVGERGGYRLDVDPSRVDAVRFGDVVNTTHPTVSDAPHEAAERMSQALALWRGRPYSDVGGPWIIEQEARRLQELWLRATEDRIEANLALGRHLESLAELEVLTIEYPLSERLHGQYMLALYRSGRQAEALRVFDRVRRRLVEDLGVDPSPELEDLTERILRHDESLRTPPTPAPARPAVPSEQLQRARGYELRDVVASTRTGVIYRGYQPSVGREVAVQIVDPQFVDQGEFIRRFENEAKAAGRLEHPHVVAIYDCWRDSRGGYVVTPWLHGGTLADALTGEPWQVDRVLEVIRQVGSALGLAHRHGIVHGAIGPDNVLLDEDGNAYLTGFGFSRWLEAGSRPRAVVAPEESPDGEPTQRSDVFGLGALACMLVSGAAPNADTIDRRSLDTLEPGVGRALAWATASDPDERCPSVDQLLLALGGTDPVFTPLDDSDLRNPYKGLEAFEETDASAFFGRDDLVAELWDGVHAHPVVCVVGPSGIGKSSVVRAGLLPRIRRSEDLDWYVTDMYPGAHPFGELTSALERVAVAQLPDLGEGAPAETAAAIRASLPRGGRLLVFIDQFEELFTLTVDDSERTRFFDLLSELAGGYSDVTLVFALRADYVERAMQHAGLGQLVSSAPVLIGAPDAPALEQMIRGPAELVGVRWEHGLVERIISDVADQPGGLPLLEYALAQVFEARTGPLLTADVYDSVGGVIGALDRTAEAAFARLEPHARDAARRLFLRLVTVDDAGHVTRRRLGRSEIETLGAERHILDLVVGAFGDARLLTFDRNPVTRSPTLEVAHEALISAWRRLDGWIESHREDLILTRRLAEAVAQWEEVDRDPGYLLSGGRLEQFESMAAATEIGLSSRERQYLAESRTRADARGRRRHRVRLGATLGFAAIAFVAVVLGVFASRRAAEAREARDLALSRELAASAVNLIDDDPELSILLALEAVRVAEPPLEARVALRSAIASHRTIRTYAQPVDLETRRERALADLDAQGRLLAISAGGHLELWDIDKNLLEWELDLPGDLVDRYGLQLGAPIFSPDSRRLEVLARWVPPPDDDSKPSDLIEGLLVVDVDSGETVEAFPAPGCDITGIVDGGPHVVDTGRILVERMAPAEGQAGGCDPTITEFAWWQPETGVYGPVAKTTTLDLRGRSVSADGRELAFTGTVTTVIDTDSGEVLLSVPTEESEIATLSPDGALLLVESAEQPRHLVLWDVMRGEQLDNLYHDAAISAEFSRDGSIIATGGGDGTARVWDASNGELLLSLRGHTSFVAEVEADRGGETMVTVSADRTIRVWTLAPVGEIGAFDLPPGQRRADGIDVRSGHGIAQISTTEESGRTVPFDLAGHITAQGPATAGQNARMSSGGDVFAAQRAIGPRTYGSVWIHDAITAEPLVEMQGMCEHTDGEGPDCHDLGNGAFADRVWDFAFSPDGRTLVMGGLLTRSFTVWDTGSGRLIHNSGPLWTDDPGSTGPVSLAFDPDGTRLAVAGRNSLQVYETSTWSMTDDVAMETRLSFLGLRFSPDGGTLIGKGSDGTFISYDTDSWEPRRPRVTAHGGLMRDLEVSDDGEMIATAGQDGFVRLWDAATSELVDVIPMPGGGPAQNVEFVDEDRHILVSGNTGPAMIETLDFAELVGIAQSRLTRSLTAEECQTYLREACEQGD